MANKYCFKMDKLIRDLVPEMMRSRGMTLLARTMERDEYIQRLKDKLLEETNEIIEAKTSAELLEEFADVFEVIHALAKECNLSMEQIETKRCEKKQKNGAFGQRIYSAAIEMDADNENISYFLARPAKYPEIKIEDAKNK